MKRADNLNLFFFALLFTGILIISSGCTSDSAGSEEKTVLKILPAGSLMFPFEYLEEDYESKNPGIDVQYEGHGSIQCVRQVTDLNRNFDLIVVADSSLIPDMMMRVNPESGVNYSDGYTEFATNEIVIAYTDKSLYSDEINERNWHEILKRPDVTVGFSNPMLDAAGYRAFMLFQLAGQYYGNENLIYEIAGDHMKNGITVEKSGDIERIMLPELVQPSDEKLKIRDGSIFLLYLLESGGVDYAIEYKSVAEGHDLNYVRLPEEINLGDSSMNGYYDDVSVNLGFERFSSIGSEREGRAAVYAWTIPNNAENPDEAERFAEYMEKEFRDNRFGWPPAL